MNWPAICIVLLNDAESKTTTKNGGVLANDKKGNSDETGETLVNLRAGDNCGRAYSLGGPNDL